VPGAATSSNVLQATAGSCYRAQWAAARDRSIAGCLQPDTVHAWVDNPPVNSIAL
jgi:hypothetical protein